MRVEEKIKSFYSGNLKILKPREVRCKCGRCERTQEIMDKTIIKAFMVLRDYIKQPIIIKSGFRCPQHNIAVNGARNSMHMAGMALDLMPKDYNIDEFYNLCLSIPDIKE